jgi:hypothetical protein
MEQELNELKNRLDELEILISNPDSEEEIEERFYFIKAKIDEFQDYPFREKEEQLLRKMSKKLNQIKNDLDLYDEEAELDMMFPNRHDDDFDSYSNMFEG